MNKEQIILYNKIYSYIIKHQEYNESKLGEIFNIVHHEIYDIIKNKKYITLS